MLTLEPLHQKEGDGYGVTSPLEAQLVTEASTMEEAFEMARDAIAALRASRRRYARRIAEVASLDEHKPRRTSGRKGWNRCI